MSVKVRSAEGEAWWPEFVRDYGEVPLRELARRYATNARRLRRAAQRAGLTSEPDGLRQVLDRLGKAPDAVLAEHAGVTTEVIAGARRRRDIAAYLREAEETTPAEPNPVRSSDTERPPPRRKRDEDPDAVVVVRRSSTSLREEPSFTRQAPRLPTAPAGPVVVARSPRRRRRIVVQDARPEPEPVPAAAPRRRAPRRERLHSEVRVITPEPQAPAPPKVTPKPEPEPPPKPTPEVGPAPPKPPVVRVARPVVQAAPVAAPAAPQASQQLWWARVLADGEEREVVVEAADLSSAAAVARTEGEVLRLERAQQI